MIQRALQQKFIAAIGTHRQGEDGLAAGCCRQGDAIDRYRIAQRLTARLQPQAFQGRQGAGLGAQLEAAAPVGAEVHQRIQGTGSATDAQYLAAFGIAGGQGVFMHQPDHARALAILPGLHRHVVFHVDDEATRCKAADYRIAVAVDGDQQTGEVESEPGITEGLAVIAILARMIQRALQREQEAAVRIDHQREHRVAASGSGQGGAIGRNRIGQRNPSRGQPLTDQGIQGRGTAIEGETAAAVGTEIDQGIQCARCACQGCALRCAFEVAIAQRILVNQTCDHWPLVRHTGLLRRIVVDPQGQAAGSRIADAIGDDVVEQKEQVVLVAAARRRGRMIERGENAELIGTGG